MGLRKNYRNLTDDERERFIQALYHVKANGIVDQFAEIHSRHFRHLIHVTSHFLPWHREFILRFERALQEHDPNVTIPYCDWTVDRNPSDLLWDNSFLGQFDSAWGLGRVFGGVSLPTAQQVEANQGRDNYNTFWRELENPIHNFPHIWVGGVMADVAAPGDPTFFLHHCWIDLLWVRWQLAHPDAPFVASQPDAELTDPLMEWPDRTPAEVLDHHALGYTYDTETVVPTGPSAQVAFHANTGVLGININGTPSSWEDTNLGMMAGTSPSIAALPGGGYAVAFHVNTGVLGININGTPSSWEDTNLGMMAGTSPSIYRRE